MNAYEGNAYMCCATSDVATPIEARAKPSCMCRLSVIVSKRPLWPAPKRPLGGTCASRISFILWPRPQLVRYMCPAKINTIAIAKWW